MKRVTMRLAMMGLVSTMLCVTPAFGASVSISGTVKDADGKPVAGVTIGIRTNSSATAVTGADGSFKLSGEYTPYKSPRPDFPSVVMEKVMANSVLLTAAKAGCMPTRVVTKDNASGVQITLYPAPAGKVTLVGNLLGSSHMLGLCDAAAKEKHTFMLAFDGTPGIKAEFAQILKDFWPDGSSLDGDSALELENQLIERLQFNLDGPQEAAMWKEIKQHAYVSAVTVTGEIHEKPGTPWPQPWISTESFGPTTFKYPAKVMAAPKPFFLPNKPPLEIKINDKLTIKCIYVPPGRFYMGCPLIQIMHAEESPQHMATLTKGFYMAETPITYELYAAVTGDTTAGDCKNYDPKMGKWFKSSKTKENMNMDPQSAAGLSCQMFKDFCKKFTELTGKKVRQPTATEWEWAARVGVSDPCCLLDGKGRVYPNMPPVEFDPFAPVKNTAPNAWGFYQIAVMGSTERFFDTEKGHASSKGDLVDPIFPVKEDTTNPVGKHAWNVHAGAGGGDCPIMTMFRTGGTRGLPFEDEWNKCTSRERLVIEGDVTPAASTGAGVKPETKKE